MGNERLGDLSRYWSYYYDTGPGLAMVSSYAGSEGRTYS
jgi:hypothetical protein